MRISMWNFSKRFSYKFISDCRQHDEENFLFTREKKNHAMLFSRAQAVLAIQSHMYTYIRESVAVYIAWMWWAHWKTLTAATWHDSCECLVLYVFVVRPFTRFHKKKEVNRRQIDVYVHIGQLNIWHTFFCMRLLVLEDTFICVFSKIITIITFFFIFTGVFTGNRRHI